MQRVASWFRLAFAAWAASASPLGAEVLRIADGAEHRLGSETRTEHLVVQDSAAGAATRVALAEGLTIGGPDGGRLEVGGGSQLTLDGGVVEGEVTLRDSACLRLREGMIGGALRVGTCATCAARVHVAGGGVEGALSVGGASRVHLAGGWLGGGSEVEPGARLDVTGGELYGGDVVVTVRGQLLVLGGSLSGGIEVASEGRAVLLGGELMGPLRAIESGTLEVVGTGFNLGFGPVQAQTGFLNGILANGAQLVVDFAREPGARILLLRRAESSAEAASLAGCELGTPP